MPDKYTNPTWLNNDTVIWLVVGISTLGLIGRTLIRDEQINPRKLAGEVILAAIGGVLVWATGYLQGLPLVGMLAVACLTGLGGVKAIEITGQVWNTIKNKSA